MYTEHDNHLRRTRRRLTLFIMVALTVSLVGLVVNYMRPAVYESRAVIRVEDRSLGSIVKQATAPTGSDGNGVLVASVEALFTAGVGEEVWEELPELEGKPDTPEAMRAMVGLDLKNAENGVIGLAATGTDAAILPVILSKWLAKGIERTQGDIDQTDQNAVTYLTEQTEQYASEIRDKRAQIQAFQSENDIITLERDENRLIARLRGLTTSLNSAQEAESLAAAQVESITQAIQSGAPLQDGPETVKLAEIQSRLEGLEAEVNELLERYTMAYIELNPALKAVLRDRDAARRELRTARSQLSKSITARAKQTLAAARANTRRLRQDHDEARQKIADFSQKFAQYETLERELEFLDTQSQAVQDQLVQARLSLSSVTKPVTIAVIDDPTLPQEPTGPPYLRDTGIILAAALCLGLLSVLIYDFLDPRPRSDYDDMAERALGSVFTRLALNRERQSAPQPIHIEASAAPVAALGVQKQEDCPFRVLEDSELAALMNAADAQTKRIICLLLNGFSPEDIGELTREKLAQSQRSVHLPQSYFEDLAAAAHVASGQEGDALSEEDLNALLRTAAYDAGLMDAVDVNAMTVLHSYRAFLVAKGVALRDLDTLSGPLSPALRASYAVFKGDGPAAALEDIDIVHPLLKTA